MKNKRIIEAWDKLDPDETAKNRIYGRIEDKLSREQQNELSNGRPAGNRLTGSLSTVKHLTAAVKRPGFRISAAAAAICLVVTGLILFNNPGNEIKAGNFFVLTAYAFDTGDSGGITDTDQAILDRTIGCIGRFHRETNQASILKKLDWNGENIDSVTFTVNEGFIVYHVRSDADEQLFLQNKALAYGSPRNIVPYEIFERTGDNVLLLDGKIMTGETLLFWTLGPLDEDAVLPADVIITATATFNDGTTAEQVLSFDATELHASSLQNMYEWQRLIQYYTTIDLDLCELVPESVMPADVSYRFVILDQPNHKMSVGIDINIEDIQRNQFFDDDGIFRFDYGDRYGNEYAGGYVAILKMEADGSMTGMVYRTPYRER